MESLTNAGSWKVLRMANTGSWEVLPRANTGWWKVLPRASTGWWKVLPRANTGSWKVLQDHGKSYLGRILGHGKSYAGRMLDHGKSYLGRILDHGKSYLGRILGWDSGRPWGRCLRRWRWTGSPCPPASRGCASRTSTRQSEHPACTLESSALVQCCGSGSGIRCLFDPGSGIRILNPYFW